MRGSAFNVDMERFKKQLDFILEIDKEKEIYRQTLLVCDKEAIEV